MSRAAYVTRVYYRREIIFIDPIIQRNYGNSGLDYTTVQSKMRKVRKEKKNFYKFWHKTS